MIAHTFYRLWPTQEAYWNDLVDFIMASSRYRHGSNRSNVGPLPRPWVPSWTGNHDDDGHVTDTAQDLLLLDRLQLLQAGLAGYPRAATAPTTTAIGGRAEPPQRRSPQLAPEPGANGLTSNQGLTAADIAVAAAAVGAGVPITGRLTTRSELTIDHPAFTDIDAPRSLLGVTLAAIQTDVIRFHDLGAGLRIINEPSPPSPAPSDRNDSRQQRNSGNGTATEPSSRRHNYLQLGATLASDHATASEGLSRALGHVTLDGLARAADVTRRTLTNVWPDRTAFRLDLFSHLLARERQWITAAIADATAAHRRHPQTDQQIFRRVGDTIHAALSDHVDSVSFLAFAPVLTAHEATTRAQHDHDQLLDATAAELAALLDATGRQPRRGVTFRQIALAIYILADGTNRLMRTTTDIIRDDIVIGGREHTLTGFVTSSILTHTTEVVGARRKASDLAAGLIA